MQHFGGPANDTCWLEMPACQFPGVSACSAGPCVVLLQVDNVLIAGLNNDCSVGRGKGKDGQ